MRSISGLLLATFVATLSTNILATALPRILSSLHVGVGGYTWVVTTYILVLTVSVPVWGKLADLWNKKRLIQLVLVLYLTSSVVAGCATSAWVLILGRAVQGLGTGGLAALSQVVLASIIAPRQRGRYNGYSGAVFALGTVSGPLVGGLLVNTPGLTWRACFFASVPFGLLSLYLIHRNLHIPATPPRKVRIDLVGATLVVADSSILISWMSLAGTRFPWWSWWTLAVVALVGCLTTAFVLVELRTAEPLVRLRLLRIGSVSLAAGASFFSGIVAFAAPLFLSQYFQLGHGFSAVHSGLETLPAVAGIFAASWVVGRLITATGRMKVFLVIGTLAQLLGVAALGWFPDHAGAQALIAPMFMLGIGIGVLQQNVVLFVQNIIPAADLGSGSGAVQFCRFLGGALGVSALGALSAARVTAHVAAGLHGIGRRLPGGAITRIPDLHSLPHAVAAVYERGYAQGFADLFTALLPLMLVPLIAAAFMRDVSLSETVRSTSAARPAGRAAAGPLTGPSRTGVTMVKANVTYDMRSPDFGAPAQALYKAAVEQCRWADDHGFDSVVLSEHHDTLDGYLPSPLVLGAALAAATKQMLIEFSVVLAPLYHPLRLAEDLAVVDLISQGRMRLTVGAGYRPSEYAMFGLDIRYRPSLLTEAITTLQAAWTGEPFEFRGAEVRVLPRPAQRPRPAIVLGGASPASARRAARIADGYAPVHPRLYEIYLEELRLLGRPAPADHGFRGQLSKSVYIAEDPERAWAQLARHALHDANEYARWADGLRGLYRPASDADELRKTGQYPVLSPDEAVEQLRGVGRVCVRPLLGGVTPDIGWECLELFADRVLPRLREVT